MKNLLIAITMVLVAGCSQRLVDFTMLSTKNMDLSRAGSYVRGERTTGEDRIPIIIFIPCGSPNLKEAIDNTIEDIPGCVGLVDGVVYTGGWYIPLIYGCQYITVEGTPLIDPAKEYSRSKTTPGY